MESAQLYEDTSQKPDDPILLARKSSGQIPSGSENPSKAGAGRGFINPPIPKTAKYAKGGVTRADGCITKGHTKGRMV
jgi:hypothetical protein